MRQGFKTMALLNACSSATSKRDQQARQRDNNGIVHELHQNHCFSPNVYIYTFKNPPKNLQRSVSQSSHSHQPSATITQPTATMCQGYTRKHEECGHIKDFVVVIQCEAFSNNEPCPAQAVLFDLTYSPPLCRACYIKKEEFIFGLYEDEIGDLRRALDDIRSSLRRVEELRNGVRGRPEAELADLQQRLDDAIADRRGMLGKFRRSQGVWGDG